MCEFHTPTDLIHNRGPITDPAAFAKKTGAASWLYLCGEEFTTMPGGMSYADVRSAVTESVNLIADPPRPFDMDVARRGVAALDDLPRPTLVTCRTGPRSSALVYLYSGLRAGASVDTVLARAAADGAPFVDMEPLKDWLRQAFAELSSNAGAVNRPDSDRHEDVSRHLHNAVAGTRDATLVSERRRYDAPDGGRRSRT